jgi:hypothetical protein
MGGHWELIWFGLALLGIGAGIAFLFWVPSDEEDDLNQSLYASELIFHRRAVLWTGLLLGLLGLAIAVWHAIRLIFA